MTNTGIITLCQPMSVSLCIFYRCIWIHWTHIEISEVGLQMLKIIITKMF